MNDKVSETSETSTYQKQMQLAIEQSILMSNEQNYYANESENILIPLNNIDTAVNNEVLFLYCFLNFK